MINLKVGLWGSSGFVGSELIKILSERSEITIVYPKINQKITNQTKDIQIAFLALPEKQSMELVPKLLQQEIKVIDLSGAYRLKKVSDYRKYYGLKHLYPELLNKAVYGLPEKNRNLIQNANLIANPGCYSTAIELGLLPLLNSGLISSTKIRIKAISGYTGGGKKVKIPKRITPYKTVRKHQHIPEIEQELNLKEQLFFYPNIAPYPRGIKAEIYLKIGNSIDVFDLYSEFYKHELFVRVLTKEVKIEDVIRTNFCNIFPKKEDSRLVIQVVIDNLGKGGAGQAIQNLNILSGFPEESVY